MLLGQGAYKVNQVEQDHLVHQETRVRLENSVLLELLVHREVRDSLARLENLDLPGLLAETEGPVLKGQLASPVVLGRRAA